MDINSVLELNISDAQMLMKAAGVLEAQEQLALMQACDYPHMKAQARSKLYNQIRKRAVSHMESKERALTTEELARVLGRNFNGK